MASPFAPGLVKRAADVLAWLLPSREAVVAAASSSTSSDAEAEGVEELRLLERRMKRICATLEDAEDKWDIRDAAAKLRLRELKKVACDAEDVVGEYQFEVARCRVEARNNNTHKRKHGDMVYGDPYENTAQAAHLVPVPHELVVRARKIIKYYDEIMEDHEDLLLSNDDGWRIEKPNGNQHRPTSSIVQELSIVGREEDKEAVLQTLLAHAGNKSTDSLAVFAIVGMGGSGKTTLAQLVYNDPRILKYFKLKAWIYVSMHFDVEVLTKNIILAFKGTYEDNSSLDGLQQALIHKVVGKSFLLVLDDVWIEQPRLWESFLTPLLKARCGKIIVTTRNEAVAKLTQTIAPFNLKCLNHVQSWLLFKQSAFRGDFAHDKFVEIGMKIATKCKGLPLAIKTLGSMLCYEADEDIWEDVLDSDLWDLDRTKDEILPALELSYKHLPMHLKRCFTALSLLPKGEMFSELGVIRLWKSLGLLYHDERPDGSIGRSYLCELKQRSLIHVWGFWAEAMLYGMHDLTHALASFVAREEFLGFEGDLPVEIPPNLCYLSINGINGECHDSFRNPLFRLHDSSALRAMHVLGATWCEVELQEELFLKLRCLRAIDLSGAKRIRKLPNSVGTLKHLQYLRIANTLIESLPHSIWKLYNLRTLDCQNCIIRQIPADIQNLVNLEHLVLDCHVSLPYGIGRLTKLQTLRFFPVEENHGRCNISELKNLDNLQGELHLSNIGNVTNVDEAKEACLRNKQYIEVVTLEYGKFNGTGQQPTAASMEMLLESLCPHHNIKELHIHGYLKYLNHPSWLGNARFSNLVMVELYYFECPRLPTLGQLPSLKYVKIRDSCALKSVGPEFCRRNALARGFKSLQHLEFRLMTEWAEWSGVEDGEFCSLQTLRLVLCPELKALPAFKPSLLSSLKISHCDSLLTVPHIPTLALLNCERCSSLNMLPHLPSLREISITDCPSLAAVPPLPSLTSLRLKGRFMDDILNGLASFCHKSLEKISIISETIKCIPLKQNKLPSLVSLSLSCENLEGVLAGLTSLRELRIDSCPKFSVHEGLTAYLRTMEISDYSTSDHFLF